MALTKTLERIKYMDSLIRRKATGNPDVLARKLALSRSQVLRLIKEMKEAGFPIEFSKECNSYYYTEEGGFVLNLFSRELSVNDMRKIYGGKSFFHFFPESHYMRLYSQNFVE